MKHGLFHKQISVKDIPFEAAFSPVITFESTDESDYATLQKYGLDGEYKQIGIFNDHPVYSNGKTQWAYLTPDIEPTITTPGYYLFDLPRIELSEDDIVDLTDEFANYITKEA